MSCDNKCIKSPKCLHQFEWRARCSSQINSQHEKKIIYFIVLQLYYIAVDSIGHQYERDSALYSVRRTHFTRIHYSFSRKKSNEQNKVTKTAEIANEIEEKEKAKKNEEHQRGRGREKNEMQQKLGYFTAHYICHLLLKINTANTYEVQCGVADNFLSERRATESFAC